MLITGGAGFIGATLVRALEQTSSAITVLDDGRACGLDALRDTAATLVRADLLDADLEALVADADAVVHLAGRTSIGASFGDAIGDLHQNVQGTMRLLDAARDVAADHRGRPQVRLVFASSAAVLGLAPVPADEATPPDPTSPYGVGKLAAELYLRTYQRRYGIETVSLRLANAYGPFSEHKSSAIPAFIRQALAGQPLRINGDGSQTRDFVYVDDVVAAIQLVLAAPAETVAGGVFNVGSGLETSIGTVAEVIRRMAGVDVPIEHRPLADPGVRRSLLDIRGAQEKLGYAPRVSLEGGIGKTVAWWRSRALVPAGD